MVKKAIEAWVGLYPLGVGVEFRSIGPLVDSKVKAPYGGMAVVVEAMVGGVPCRKVFDRKLTVGEHPAMALSKICEAAAKELRLLSKRTVVEKPNVAVNVNVPAPGVVVEEPIRFKMPVVEDAALQKDPGKLGKLRWFQRIRAKCGVRR